jgi:hypothetical protein
MKTKIKDFTKVCWSCGGVTMQPAQGGYYLILNVLPAGPRIINCQNLTGSRKWIPGLMKMANGIATLPASMINIMITASPGNNI